MTFAIPQHVTISQSLPQNTSATPHALVPRKGCSHPRTGFTDPAGNNLTLVTCSKSGQADATKFLQPFGIVPAPLQTSPKQDYEVANWDTNHLYATNASAIDAGVNFLLHNKTAEVNHAAGVANRHAMSIGIPISAGVTAICIGLLVYLKCYAPKARRSAREQEYELRRSDVERATGSYSF